MMKKFRKLAWVVLAILAVTSVGSLAALWQPLTDFVFYKDVSEGNPPHFGKVLAEAYPTEIPKGSWEVRQLLRRWLWLPVDEQVWIFYDVDGKLIARRQPYPTSTK